MIRAIKVIKAVLRKAWTIASTLVTKSILKANGISFGKGLRAIGIPSVNVSIGGTAAIGQSLYLRTGVGATEVGTAGSRIRVGRRGHLKIGDRVGMSNATIVCDESVEIGNDVFIGGGVQVFDTNFHSTDAATRTDNPQKDVRTAPVHIGDRVFLGANSMIGKGVSIGDDAVVAAGSIVVHDIPSGEIWGGNPALKIR